MDSLNSLDELLDFDEDKGAKPSGVPPSGVLCPADPSRPLPKTEACEEEELEWLSNKDAFPAVEMAALVGSIGLLTGGIGNAKHQSPVSVLESNTTTITPTLMSSCGIPKPPHRARSKGRSKRGNSSFAGILGQRLLWNHASANVNDEGEKGKTTKEKRKCQHCGASETPLWRQGPLGPKTLCNACGMRHRSGRLVPEYRPLHSPTFSKNLHSNIHKKVVEMRKKESGTEMVVKPVDKGFPGIPEEKDLRQAHKYRRVKVTKAETMRTSITPKNEEGLCFPGIPEKELLNQTHKYSIVEGTEVETRRITIARKNEEGLSISGIPEEERLNQSNKYRKVEGTKAETMRTSITRKNDEGLCFPRIPDKELLNRTHKYNKVEGTEAETRRMTIARKNKEGLAFSGIPEDERLNQSNKYSKVEGTKAGTMRLVITRKNEEEGLAAPYVHPPFVEGTPIKKSCQSCGAKNTLQWRQGSLGKKTLCYACWRRCKSEIIKKKCQRCGTEKTPKWWALGEEHLCNSCGVKHNSKLIKRKCLHCGTEETSRWWALGADTLCNVCGVEHNSETFERKCQQCGTEHSHHWCIIGAKTLCSDCGVKYKSEIIGRNCQHCRTEKTLQWWAGPFGSKTLCDGCGVMYSSGSLDPENSPSDTQHSQASCIQIGTRL